MCSYWIILLSWSHLSMKLLFLFILYFSPPAIPDIYYRLPFLLGLHEYLYFRFSAFWFFSNRSFWLKWLLNCVSNSSERQESEKDSFLDESSNLSSSISIRSSDLCECSFSFWFPSYVIISFSADWLSTSVWFRCISSRFSLFTNSYFRSREFCELIDL